MCKALVIESCNFTFYNASGHQIGTTGTCSRWKMLPSERHPKGAERTLSKTTYCGVLTVVAEWIMWKIARVAVENHWGWLSTNLSWATRLSCTWLRQGLTTEWCLEWNTGLSSVLFLWSTEEHPHLCRENEHRSPLPRHKRLCSKYKSAPWRPWWCAVVVWEQTLSDDRCPLAKWRREWHWNVTLLFCLWFSLTEGNRNPHYKIDTWFSPCRGWDYDSVFVDKLLCLLLSPPQSRDACVRAYLGETKLS